MDTQKINAMLHRDKIQDHYNMDVGSGIVISAPRVPMTRYTEFVSVEPEEEGDVDSFRVQPSFSSGEEGVLAPSEIKVQSIGPGTLRLNFVAKDSSTGIAIPGVEPVEVIVSAI